MRATKTGCAMPRTDRIPRQATTCLFALVLTLALAACGGGGNSAGLHEIGSSQGTDALSSSSSLGTSVAVSGTTVVAGSPGYDLRTGAVSVFRLGRSGLHQTAQLYGSDSRAFDEFGGAVAISGRLIVAGSQYHDGSGRAYVFEESARGWTEIAELKASDGSPYDQFGESVAVSNGTIVVGAPGHELRTGSVYVFARSGSGWRQVAELKGRDTVTNDEFGGAVAISGRTIIAGAQYHDNFVGRAYVFEGSGRKWREAAELKGARTAPGGYFGGSVAISGHTAVVGAYDEAAAAGRAYVFQLRHGTWRQVSELKGSDTGDVDEFGCSVAVSGNEVVVGAEYHARGAGRVYVFAPSGHTWAQRAELALAGAPAGANFGSSVAVSGKMVVAGAPHPTAPTGDVSVFS